jgi:hypothetical protein
MRIKDVRAHVLEAALGEPFSWSLGWARRRTALLVEIEAADGTVGWGESYGPARPNAAVVEAMTPLLIGADALASEAIRERLYAAFRDHGQKRLPVQALSGIDIALWDLKGKHFAAPAHRLIDGADRGSGVRHRPLPARVRRPAQLSGWPIPSARRDPGIEAPPAFGSAPALIRAAALRICASRSGPGRGRSVPRWHAPAAARADPPTIDGSRKMRRISSPRPRGRSARAGSRAEG